MCCCSSSSGESCEWVVVAGWITRLFTSATLASSEKIFRLSINAHASFSPPFTSKVKMLPPPFGKSFSYNAWSGWSGNEGWLTFATLGWLARNSTTFFVLNAWRSTRSDRVSSPWSRIQALNGEIAAPVSRRMTARIRVTKAAGPATSAKTAPW